jgi:hypothetical protein
LSNEDGIVKPELGDAGGDLRHLRFRMQASVAGVGNQALNRPSFNLQVMCKHFYVPFLTAQTSAL